MFEPERTASIQAGQEGVIELTSSPSIIALVEPLVPGPSIKSLMDAMLGLVQPTKIQVDTSQ